MLSLVACVWPTASLQAQAVFPSDPVPINDKTTWVTHQDWPSDLYQQQIEGSVSTELDVGADGKIKNCRILQTSGYAAMDEVVCLRLVERAEFDPAHDESGRPVEGVFTFAVRFAISNGVRALPEEGSRVMEMLLDASGKVIECTVTSIIANQNSLAECEVGGSYEPVRDAQGNTVRVRARWTTTMEYEVLPD